MVFEVPSTQPFCDSDPMISSRCFSSQGSLQTHKPPSSDTPPPLPFSYLPHYGLVGMQISSCPGSRVMKQHHFWMLWVQTSVLKGLRELSQPHSPTGASRSHC